MTALPSLNTSFGPSSFRAYTTSRSKTAFTTFTMPGSLLPPILTRIRNGVDDRPQAPDMLTVTPSSPVTSLAGSGYHIDDLPEDSPPPAPPSGPYVGAAHHGLAPPLGNLPLSGSASTPNLHRGSLSRSPSRIPSETSKNDTNDPHDTRRASLPHLATEGTFRKQSTVSGGQIPGQNANFLTVDQSSTYPHSRLRPDHVAIDVGPGEHEHIHRALSPAPSMNAPPQNFADLTVCASLPDTQTVQS